MSHERFAAVIADIATTLPADHVAAWASVLMRVDGPVDRTATVDLIDARPGFSVAAHAERLIGSWQTQAPDLPGAAVALALRSAAGLHQRVAAQRTELAVSGPTTASVPVRLTSSVVVGIIRAARGSLLVASFAAFGVAEVVAELRAAAGRGVHIDLILESSAADGGALRGSVGAAATFADLRGRATFWHWPAARRGTGGSSPAALHAKFIAADGEVALISSANLTDRALSHNIEVGVVLHDPAVVHRLVAHFRALSDPRTGPLERLD
ncbi:DISARM system phospholipase D-like protein DrmC [Micromonospora sp. NPDC006766]|uniref:DISARM system phospholipase D-like protein DrmC n=1 Tax=Micromonospora sp. NPDC006766 TaxID=3154778 RepID=UPI0034072E50